MSKAIDKWFPLFLTMINVSLSLSLSLVCLCLFSGDSMRFPCSISIIPFWIHPSCWVTLLFWGVQLVNPGWIHPSGIMGGHPHLWAPSKCPKKCELLRPMKLAQLLVYSRWTIPGRDLGCFSWPNGTVIGMETIIPFTLNSMDWFKGKSTGNHGFYHQI